MHIWAIWVCLKIACPARDVASQGYVSRVCFAKVEHTFKLAKPKTYKSIYQLPLQDRNAQLSDGMLFSFCSTKSDDTSVSFDLSLVNLVPSD